MDPRTCYVKYDVNTFSVLLRRLLTSEDVYVKNKLIEMLTLYTYENENMCRKIIDLSIGTMIPEPIKTGTKVKIDKEKTGWLGTSEKEILDKNTIDEAVYGTVLSFNGYHSYNAYTVGFPEGTVNLPMEAVSDVTSIL
jgi:hypothetical protein